MSQSNVITTRAYAPLNIGDRKKSGAFYAVWPPASSAVKAKDTQRAADPLLDHHFTITSKRSSTEHNY